MKTWMVVANRSEARLFELSGRGTKARQQLKLLKKMENPKGRLKSGEINAERPGISTSSVTFARGRLAKKQSPEDRIAQIFAKSISEELERGCNEHLFDHLILVIEPNFLGVVRAALSKKTFKAVSETFHKDLVNLPDHDLSLNLWPEEPRAEMSL